MKILAFDTANNNNDVAILDGSEVLARNFDDSPSSQAELLVPLIERTLNEAKIWYQDLDLIVSTKGPGNFTGVRIGYTVAKTIKLSTQCPLILINNLKALSFNYIENYEGKILVVMDAKLEEFFIQELEVKDHRLIEKYEPKLIKYEDLNKYAPESEFLVIGSGKFMAQDILSVDRFRISKEKDKIKAENLARIGEIDFKEDKNQEHDILYVRKPNITKPSN